LAIASTVGPCVGGVLGVATYIAVVFDQLSVLVLLRTGQRAVSMGDSVFCFIGKARSQAFSSASQPRTARLERRGEQQVYPAVFSCVVWFGVVPS